jgi:hypothetical protein
LKLWQATEQLGSKAFLIAVEARRGMGRKRLRPDLGHVRLCVVVLFFGIDPNRVAKLVSPLASSNEKARGMVFAVYMNVKRTGSHSDNLTGVAIRPDVRIGQDNVFSNMKWMVLFWHRA